MPLLAVDIGTVMTAVFLIVMFLGWVMQAVQGQNGQGPNRRGGGAGGRGAGGRGQGGQGERRPAQQRPRPRRDDRIRSEIDAFLEEVDGRADAEPVIEIVEPPRERPRPVRPQQQRPQPQRPRPERPRPQQRPKPSRPEPRANRPKPRTEERGTGVSAHVSTYMDSQIDEGVAEHLPHLVSSVSTSGGGSSSSAGTVPARPVHPLVARLRSPEGIRQAIVLTEILARPRPLRDRD